MARHDSDRASPAFCTNAGANQASRSGPSTRFPGVNGLWAEAESRPRQPSADRMVVVIGGLAARSKQRRLLEDGTEWSPGESRRSGHGRPGLELRDA